MMKKIVLIIYAIITIGLFSVFIYKKEMERVDKIIRQINKTHKCPISRVNITLFNTYLKSKNELYIRIFSHEDVIIHELAHSLCKDIGHTDDFYEIYNQLLALK